MNETNKSISAIWKEVLNIDLINQSDSFFKIGGQSLKATRVISKMRRLFKAKIPLRFIFESPTLEEFSIRVDEFIETHQ